MHQNPAAENEPLLTPSLRTTLWSSRLIFAFLFFIAALLVRLPNFNESLWYDEVWYTFMRLNPNSINRVLFHDVHPPLYPLLILGWIKLFGDSEIAVRLPSLLFGLASLGVMFALARSWFNRRIAFLSTILMALSPVHIWYSQENKNNMLLLLLTVLTVYGLQQAWTRIAGSIGYCSSLQRYWRCGPTISPCGSSYQHFCGCGLMCCGSEDALVLSGP